MTKGTFLHEVKKGRIPNLNGYDLYPKKRKCSLVNLDTGDTMTFRNAEEAYENGIINGKTIKGIVDSSDFDDIFITTLDDSGNKMP